MNSPLLRTGIILAALMFAATALAVALRPTHKIADDGPKIDLETMIPRRFGEWQEDKAASALVVDPRTSELINQLYSQTLTRSYLGGNGDRIMLSIAYGGNQSDAMQVHKPEICYPAQGFQVLETAKDVVMLTFGRLPVKHILAVQGGRVEPITYWITVGDKVTRSAVEQKWVQLTYGLRGKVPDGLLVRVSSIDRDQSHAYQVQAQFLSELLTSMDSESRTRIVGRLQ